MVTISQAKYGQALGWGDKEKRIVSRAIFEVEFTEFGSQFDTCVSKEESGRKR